MIVCVAANPSIDKLFGVREVTVGAIHRPTTFVQVAGGKGLNAARAAATLGADVTAVALLGGHAGAWIAQALEGEGIVGHFTWTEAETRSCLSVSDGSGRLTEFYEWGREVEAESWSSLRKALDELMEGADWLILSGSLPPGVPPDGYVEVIDAAHREGVKVAVDTRDESLAAAVARGPELIKINAQESAAMLGVPVTSAQEAATAAKVLRSRSGQHASVVITRGTEGAIALEARCWQARSPARGPFPVGSGDSFLAGLVTGLDRGWEWRQALALALGAGAANAEQPGAGRLDRQRAESLAAEVEIAELPPP